MALVTRPITVLLSGGQDSATCLYWARERFSELIAVSFEYGQRHRVELEQAKWLAADAGVDHHAFLPVEALMLMGAASLTNPDIANAGDGRERNVYADEHGLPPSFVPGRNVVFFALAAAYGAIHGSRTIVTGVCEQDRAGYPDCRSEFVDAMRKSLGLALDLPDFDIEAPLLYRNKAKTWQLAEELGVIDRIVEHTNTCYEGDREHRHPWGYGCGKCGACVERERGWNQWLAGRATLAGR